MDDSKKHDAWNDGSSYEAYMGRWSSKIAVEWLKMPSELDWMEVGCGSGALSSSILSVANLRRLKSVDPFNGFVQTTVEKVNDERHFVSVGHSEHLNYADANKDVVGSGLVLIYVEDRDQSLVEMTRVVKNQVVKWHTMFGTIPEPA